MNKRFILLLFAVLILTSSAFASIEHYVNSWSDLNSMRNYLNDEWFLMTDLNSSSVGYAGIGDNWQPIGNNTNPFHGIFYGQSHTISNLKINKPSTLYVGLFGYDTGNISDVGLIDENVIGYYNVGGLVGVQADGIISNSYTTGVVDGNQGVGGLVGYQGGTITDSYSTANVSGADTGYNVGGLVGNQDVAGIIIDSYATGNASGGYNVGGLVGQANGDVTNSYSTGTVVGVLDEIGGLVGDQNGNIIGSYATGDVNGNNYVGGLVGYNQSGVDANSYATGNLIGVSYVGGLIGESGGTITNSYSIGHVDDTGSFLGAFIGYQFGGTITNSFFDTQTSGLGFACNNVCSGATGKTTAEMKTLTPFSTATWNITNSRTNLNNGYPFLGWQDNNSTFIWLQTHLFSGGTGTLVDPYQISSWIDLNNIRYDLSSSYILTRNLLSSDSDYTGVGNNWQPIGTTVFDYFSGNFDGQGYTISNLIVRQNGNNSGLFGDARYGALRNIGLLDENIWGEQSTGGLVGYSEDVIDNAYTTGTIHTTNGVTGGLVGYMTAGSITNSHSDANVHTDTDAGGLGGQVMTLVQNCYATGTVTGSNQAIGGLLGTSGGTILNSYATGTVNGAGANDVGGLVGWTFGTIHNSYATGNVIGTNHVGGLFGYYSADNSINNYSIGHVSGNGTDIGGMIGLLASGNSTNSFWDINTSGQTTSAGSETGLTDTQMKVITAYNSASWNIANTDINLNNGYPFLAWQANNSDYIWLLTSQTCTSWTYSAWGSCVNNSQSRTVLTSSPAGCTGGSPVLTQSCVSPNPIPTVQGYTSKTCGLMFNGINSLITSLIIAVVVIVLSIILIVLWALSKNQSNQGSTGFTSDSSTTLATIVVSVVIMASGFIVLVFFIGSLCH